MNDAVKPDVSDEMVELFGINFWPINAASKIDAEREHIRNAISAALAAQGQEPVADLEEAIRLAEVGEYLYNACAYSYGDGYTEPREYGIEWQWQQSKPDEFGQGQLLAASTRWHQEQSSDGFVTEASKLRSALTAPAQPVENDIADAVLSWMVKNDLLDAGNEYRASDVLAVLDDLAPARPVGVPVGYVSTVELHTLRNIDTCVDLFSMPPDEDGFQFVPVYAAPQPPAEGGWKPMEQIGNLLRQHIEAGESHGGRYDSEWLDRVDDVLADLRTHLAAPANGGEQNG